MKSKDFFSPLFVLLSLIVFGNNAIANPLNSSKRNANLKPFVEKFSNDIEKKINQKKSEIQLVFAGTIYYKVTLESMFQRDEKAKLDKKLADLNAPFVIDDVDYKSGIVTVKLLKKVPFNEVKYAFDQIGLRVTSEQEIIK